MFRKKLGMEELRIGGENLGTGMDGTRPLMRQGATTGLTRRAGVNILQHLTLSGAS